MDARLIFDQAEYGAWNMAADELLLESARAGQTTLRFYTWKEPTLSLGYFQSAAEQIPGIACVRRTTGGGAILHGTDLTYSFACPALDRTNPDASALYTLFHRSLIESLTTLGMTAHLCGGEDPREHEFLCFRRREAGDVVMSGHKIGGSAQRRQRGAVLLHGSVILSTDQLVPDIRGLADLAASHQEQAETRDPSVLMESLRSDWSRRIGEELKATWTQQPWSVSERERIEELVALRYGNPTWLSRR